MGSFCFEVWIFVPVKGPEACGLSWASDFEGLRNFKVNVLGFRVLG